MLQPVARENRQTQFDTIHAYKGFCTKQNQPLGGTPEQAAMAVVANAILNLDEFLTRN